MKKKIPARRTAGITLKDIIVHMQGMELRLGNRMGGLEGRMDGLEDQMGGLENQMGDLKKTLGGVQKDVFHIKNALQRLYEKRVEMVRRLDRIEYKELPAIKMAVGMR